MPQFDIGAESLGGNGGLLAALDPSFQAKKLALNQARAFQGGVPTDANGQPDYSAMATKLLQLGDYGDANSLLQTGIAQGNFRMGSQIINQLGGNGVLPAQGGAAVQSGPGAPAPVAASSGTAPASMDVFAHAIGDQESGNKYDALGPVTKSGDRAYGRFQVMGANIPSWTKEVLGQEMTPDQFVASPRAQDAVFNAKFGGALQKYGNPADAASVWFSGRPLKEAGNASDVLGTTAPSYVSKFLAGIGPAAQAVKAGRVGGITDPDMAPTQSATEPVRSVARAATAPGSIPAAAAQPTASGAPVADSGLAAAQRRLAAAENTDPATLTLAQQQQLTADTDTVEAARQQRAAGPGTASTGAPDLTIRGASNGVPVQVAQNGTSDVPAGAHPFGPEAAGAQPTQAPAPQAVPVQAPPVQMAGGAAPVGAGLAPNPAPAPAGGPQQTVPGQQPFMVDPTLGGAITDKRFVGDPAGFLNSRLQMQVALGLMGNKTAADAVGKQADYVAQAMARSGIVTPEMKNWEVARNQGYTGSMMDYMRDVAAQKAQVESDAKIRAETDPSLIRAAGQKSAAEAAGRMQGETSPGAIAAQAQKAGTVAEATQQGDALGKLPGQLAASADSAKQQSALVDGMLDAANQFKMGAYAPAEASLNARLSDLGKRLNVDTSTIDGKLAGYQEYAKLAGQLTRQAIKETGSNRAGVQELQMVQGTLPSPAMSPDGFKSVAVQLKGTNDFTIAKQQAAQAYADPSGPGQGSLKGFDADWNKNVTPAAFVLHRMQVDQPQMFATTVQRLAQSPQGRAVLQSAKSGLAWANSRGLLD